MGTKLLKIGTSGYPQGHSETGDNFIFDKFRSGITGTAVVFQNGETGAVIIANDKFVDLGSAPTAGNHAVRKDYIDSAVAASKTITATSAESLSIGDPVYINVVGKAAKTNATSESTSDFVGMVKTAVGAADLPTVITVKGKATSNNTHTAGDKVFLGISAAGLTGIAPAENNAAIYKVGYADTTSTIVLEPEMIGIRTNG